MKILTKKQIILIHRNLIKSTSGSADIRDSQLLDLSINSPFQTFDNMDLYPSLIEKSARLGFSLISNHPFVDGNKRIGVHIMLVLLAINEIELNYTQNDLINLGLSVASGNMKYSDVLNWINNHI